MDARAAAEDVRRGQDPQHTVDDLAHTSVDVVGRRVSTWYGETSDLETLEFPEEYLSAPRLGTAIGVSHRKKPDAAWGRYVVMMVTTTHGCVEGSGQAGC